MRAILYTEPEGLPGLREEEYLQVGKSLARARANRICALLTTASRLVEDGPPSRQSVSILAGLSMWLIFLAVHLALVAIF